MNLQYVLSHINKSLQWQWLDDIKKTCGCIIGTMKELRRSNLKSVYFNFRYFAFNKACLLPVRLNKRCSLINLKGALEIEGEISPGMIQIGFGEVGIFDKNKEHSVWNVRGKIIFRGKCFLGTGIRLNIAESGILTFGRNVNITAASAIDCQREIIFGDGCLVSWDNLFIDGDHHNIFDAEGKLTNSPRNILIGSHVWIGCRCLILKGANIAENCVVAAGSVVNGKFAISNAIIAGSPAKIVKENISWQI